MNIAAFWAFLTLLAADPAALGNQQAFSALWQTAQTQVAAATPSPAPSVVALPSPIAFFPAPSSQPDLDGPGQEPAAGDADGPTASPVAFSPAPQPVASTTPASPQTNPPQAVPSIVAAPMSPGLPTQPSGSLVPVMESVPPIAVNGTGLIYSSLFTGRTPFHSTVAALMTAGATVRPDIVAQNYWAQPLNSVQFNGGTQIGGPYVVSAPGSPTYTFRCPAYGGCDAGGRSVSYPAGAQPTTDGDHHLEVLDLIHSQEVDGWGGDGGGCAIGGGNVDCSSGGVFPFSGDGLAHGGSANAFGAAFGEYLVTPLEITQGHIDHALGILQSCEDNVPSVYPAQPRSSDAVCSSRPNIAYGDMIHLKNSVNVASLGYGRTCTIVANALQKWGGYTIDSAGGRNVLFDAPSENSAPIWYGFILPEMVASGDATMNGTSFSFPGCLQRINASQIEVVRLNQAGDGALPQ